MQMHKMKYISLKMVKVVTLSENSCHFVRCSDVTTFILFSDWHKTNVEMDNSLNSTLKIKSLEVCWLRIYFGTLLVEWIVKEKTEPKNE
jgi:hypothetical protein